MSDDSTLDDIAERIGTVELLDTELDPEPDVDSGEQFGYDDSMGY